MFAGCWQIIRVHSHLIRAENADVCRSYELCLQADISTQPYFLGESFSMADAYLFVTLGWRHYVNIDISRWPTLSGYSDKIAKRPAVLKAMKEEGLIK